MPPSYYVTEESDYICSLSQGLNLCNALPNSKSQDGGLCSENVSSVFFIDNSSNSYTCINWNQYYTNCSAGGLNPFQGAISFDNIGSAFITIFQVNFI